MSCLYPYSIDAFYGSKRDDIQRTKQEHIFPSTDLMKLDI
jgi:hypothetical protein